MSLRLAGLTQLVTPADSGVTVVERAEVHIESGQVVFAGSTESAPDFEAERDLDCSGLVALPGLIDCHTHLVFGGDRSGEFVDKLAGRSYREIASEGGGIKYTVRQTRRASEEELFERAGRWLDVMLGHGVTTVEAKSGYGLSTEHELKILRVIDRLDREHPVDLVPTFLGAHELPPEYAGSHEQYITEVIEEQLPAVAEAGLAEFVDVFCEDGVFSVEQTRRVLEAGKRAGLKPKLHSDQFERLGATAMAAGLGAVSCDHLHVSNEEDLRAMRKSGTVPVALPGVPLFLGEEDTTPVQRMLELGLPVAVATDFNPGSCMCPNLPLIAQLACLEYRMTPEQALLGVTRTAAAALDRGSELGVIAPGRPADLCLLELEDWTEMFYHFGEFPVRAVVKGGELIAFDGLPKTP